MFDWNTVCATYDFIKKQTKILYDGNTFNYNIITTSKTENLSDWSIKSMKIGAFHDGTKQFEGKLTMVNIWDYVIDDLEIINQNDSYFSGGNIFDWNSATIEVNGTTIIENLTISSINHLKPGITLLPYKIEYANAKINCERIGGRIVAFNTSTQIDYINPQLEKQSICQNIVWSGYIKSPFGLFIDDENNTLQEDSFAPGEPNGGKYEMCLALVGNVGKHVDFSCMELHCTACNFNSWPMFRLRGILSEIHRMDTFYWMNSQYEKSNFYFEGSMFNKLIGNQDEWTLIDLKNQTVIKLKDKQYPIGRFDWFVGQNNTVIKLSFDSCNDTQFNCGDGLCIDKIRKCDQVKDCSDNSDEEDCLYIILPEDYNKDFPPLVNHNNEYSITIKNFSLQIENILEQENIFEINMRMTSVWRDPRIKFKDLDPYGNTVLSSQESNDIWKPNYALWLTDDFGLKNDLSMQLLVVKPSEVGNASDNTISVAHTVYAGRTVDILLGNSFIHFFILGKYFYITYNNDHYRPFIFI